MKRIVFLIIFVLLLFVFYNKMEQNIVIPDSAIRLRIIPNSNNPLDINMKEKVKNYLERNVYELTYNVEDINIARNIINDNIPKIRNDIDNIFINCNYDMDYSINYGSNYFPKKIYKGITYEEGFYESLVISIGNGEGDNFWCVLFPNLCLIDIDYEKEYKSFFYELWGKYSKRKK